MEEISNSKEYIDHKNQIYYPRCISCLYYDLTDEIVRLNIPQELFISLRNQILDL